MRQGRQPVGQSRTHARRVTTDARGHNQQAQKHLTTATTTYREMDMPFWLEQAEADRDT
jgi:hypothetical protein